MKGELNLPADMPLYRRESVLPQVFTMRDGERVQVARQEQDDENVYYIGTQAGLPMRKTKDADGKEKSGAKIKENAVHRRGGRPKARIPVLSALHIRANVSFDTPVSRLNLWGAYAWILR